MKKLYFLLAVVLCCTNSIFAKTDNFIKIIVPEGDSTTISSMFQRINGCTIPGSTVKINGKEYKVYPTGAFAGYIELTSGKNTLVIESVNPSAGSCIKKLIIYSKLPEAGKSVTGFRIESAGLVPPNNQELISGDIIEVRMKAQSGCKASFFGDKPMFELPESQTGGIAGIYQGSYQIKSNDSLKNVSIDFKLTGNNGESILATGKNTISVNTGEYPAVACTKGNFPYLSYGLGEDRLGGARIGYLDTMVYLTITGKTGDLYRVKLSETQSAYIPEYFANLMPKGTFVPYSLTDSWSVSGDKKYDYLRIGLSQRLPYLSQFEINPLRIILHIYGAVSNTNWITQLNSTREIKNVYYDQPEKNVMRVTIELNHNTAWGYSVFYERNRLVVKVKQQPGNLELSNLTIGLDAGHGGTSNGALGSTGAKEKDINLAMVLKVKTALEKLGTKVVLTRQGDEDLATSRRWQIWQKAEPDIVLSFHCNSIGNSDPLKIKGTSTYYKYIAYRPLSLIMYNKMLSTGLEEFGNVGSFNFTLNAPTEFPNTLIEMAFMSNPEDEMLLLDPWFRNKIVRGVISGLEQYLKLCKTGR